MKLECRGPITVSTSLVTCATVTHLNKKVGRMNRFLWQPLTSVPKKQGRYSSCKVVAIIILY